MTGQSQGSQMQVKRMLLETIITFIIGLHQLAVLTCRIRSGHNFRQK
jgi:hypothetical protein